MAVVSVIIPVYNVNCEYMNRCMESLFNQTFKDIEIIIIDDGSKNPDLTAFLKSLKTASDKIIVIKNRRNRGPGYARNCGICFASKNNLPFILYNDADDISQSNRLECVRKVFEKEIPANANERMIPKNKTLCLHQERHSFAMRCVYS